MAAHSPASLPGESHGWRSLGGLESTGSQRVRHDCVTSSTIHSYTHDTICNLFSSAQALSRVRLCDPMNRSTPGLPVHHQLPELTQTHVHRFHDAIQPSHPLSSPSPPAFNLSQHQGLFKWVRSLHQVAKVLEFQLQPQAFPSINKYSGLISFRIDLLNLLDV